MDTSSNHSACADCDEGEIESEHWRALSEAQDSVVSIGRKTTEPGMLTQYARVKAAVLKAKMKHGINGEATFEAPGKVRVSRKTKDSINWWINRCVMECVTASLSEREGAQPYPEGDARPLHEDLPPRPFHPSMSPPKESLPGHVEDEDGSEQRKEGDCPQILGIETSPARCGTFTPIDSPHQRLTHSLALRLQWYHLQAAGIAQLQDSPLGTTVQTSQAQEKLARDFCDNRDGKGRGVDELDEYFQAALCGFVECDLSDSNANGSSSGHLTVSKGKMHQSCNTLSTSATTSHLSSGTQGLSSSIRSTDPLAESHRTRDGSIQRDVDGAVSSEGSDHTGGTGDAPTPRVQVQTPSPDPDMVEKRDAPSNLSIAVLKSWSKVTDRAIRGMYDNPALMRSREGGVYMEFGCQLGSNGSGMAMAMVPVHRRQDHPEGTQRAVRTMTSAAAVGAWGKQQDPLGMLPPLHQLRSDLE